MNSEFRVKCVYLHLHLTYAYCVFVTFTTFCVAYPSQASDGTRHVFDATMTSVDLPRQCRLVTL